MISRLFLQVFVISGFCWLATGCGHSPKTEAQKTYPNSLLITGVSIIDPAAGTASQPRDILISHGHIDRIENSGVIPTAQVGTIKPANGLFALPGLIDVHAHIGDGGLGLQTDQDRGAALEQFVRYGVTTIFAPGGGGGNDDQLLNWKQQIGRGNLLGPGLYGSGAIITAPGSHPIGTIWGLPVDADPALVYARGAVTLGENEPVGPLLDKKVTKGIDALKIVIEDGPEPWYPRPRLSNEKITELVQAAHQRDLRIFAHVSTAAHVADGVAAGINGVMHSAEDRLSDELLMDMARKHIFYVPTLALYDGFFNQALGRFTESPYALAGVSKRALDSLNSPEWRQKTTDSNDWIEPTRKALADNLRRVVANGVPLALGTDVNNPTVFPGYSAHEELSLMVDAGLTPAQALKAATLGSAAFLDLETKLGKIQVSYQADILLLRENPLKDIANTRTLHAVILDGVMIDQVVSIDEK